MSYAWSFFGSDKKTVFLGAILIGIITCFLIGVPLLLILRNYEENIPIWFGIIFLLAVFPVVTFLSYKAGCRRLKK